MKVSPGPLAEASKVDGNKKAKSRRRISRRRQKRCNRPKKDVGLGPGSLLRCDAETLDLSHDSNWLVRDHSHNVTSQGGEDGILEEIFRRIPVSANQTAKQRWCVEFGAWDGVHLSNTRQLLKSDKWGGVLIEPTPSKFEELRALYAGQPDVTCMRRLVGLMEGDRLHDILSRTAIPRDFDLLSVDIDGADYHIWDSLPPPPAGYAPKVVVIEFNPTIPNNILYVQARDVQVQRGSSLLALAELGKRKGYELVSTTKFNAIFVQARYFSLFGITDNRVSAMHATLMPSYLFQLYDGTLMLAGCRKLIWHKTPITHEALQVLPRARRRFPFAPDHEEGAGAGEGGWEGRCVDSLVARGRRLLLAERDFEGLKCLRLATAEARRTEEGALSRVSEVYREVGEERARRQGPRDGVEWYQRAYHIAHAYCSADRRRQLALKIGHCLYCGGEDELEAARYWTRIGLSHDDAGAWKQLLKVCTKQSDERGIQRAKDNIARICNAHHADNEDPSQRHSHSGPQFHPQFRQAPGVKLESDTQSPPDTDAASSSSHPGSRPHLKRSSGSVRSRVLVCIVLATLVCMRTRS